MRKIIPFYSDNMALLYDNGYWGFVSKDGTILIPPIYENAYNFHEGLAAVQLKHRWGFINKHNHIVISFQYEHASKFQNGFAIVKFNKFFGVIDKHNSIVLPFQYDTISHTHYPHVFGVYQNGRLFYVNIYTKEVSNVLREVIQS